MSGADVLAVLDRMRDQASLGRCCDEKITAQRSIQCIDEDRNAIAAVAALIAAARTARSELFNLIANKHSPEIAAGWPEIVILDAALAACKPANAEGGA